MKHVIEFSLPEDQADVDLHIKAPRVAGFLEDWEQFLRSKVKYEEVKCITWAEVRELYFELKNEAEI